MHEKNPKVRDTSGMSDQELEAYLSGFEVTKVGRWEFHFDAMDRPEIYLEAYNKVLTSIGWNKYLLERGLVSEEETRKWRNQLEDDETALGLFHKRYPTIEQEREEYLRQIEEAKLQTKAMR